ncbi:hypothetical protein [Qingshengfaniella alkalisoli]|uniref:Uncharacterized protein n=1 Tax=Qingshengfaniella alkalisoli TaxID=2599296 RepID=A0A5B8IUK3_9RHOB|nr:hypothetical protein [Qingshengfaniella alkalisoli]QDY68541.1 hypothetical protein FPZ52_02165 [Qingshengfaniella alkalisoli]
MTALTQYERLEAPGVWRESAQAQRKNVFVSLGDATLIIRDSAETVLAHWSLPAVERSNSKSDPAIFTPAPGSEEILEIDDPTMIDAIETVRHAVKRSGRPSGTLRKIAFAAIALACIAVGVVWLPDAVTRHTAQALPDPTRAAIGQKMLSELEKVTGQACAGREGRATLANLLNRLFSGEQWKVVIVPSGPALATHLPGQTLLARADLITKHTEADALASALLVEAEEARQSDPMVKLMTQMGMGAALSLLTTGALPDKKVADYADDFLIRDTSTLTTDTTIGLLESVGISSRPYAYALDDSGETTLALIEADPFPAGTPEPLMSDSDWLRLQGVCEE